MAKLLVPEWKNIRSERVRNYETYLFVVKGELGDPMLAIRPEPNVGQNRSLIARGGHGLLRREVPERKTLSPPEKVVALTERRRRIDP